LRTLFRFGVVGDESDGQLLARFVGQKGECAEAAFTTLVRRHGPMVLGVCRRVLNSSHEAEDAFQSTFLVLAKKAAMIARRETLANWLYGVALRTAKDARSRMLRRRAWEKRACTLRVITGPGEDPALELRAILDEELSRLPARLREPLLLCELQTLSRHDAARRLGIAEGTLSSRLARAKALLRERLSRRGLGLTTGVLTAGLVREAQAAVPHALAETTTCAATLVAAGCSLTGLVAASVLSMTEEVLRAMLFAKLRSVAIGTFAVAAVVTGAVVLGQAPSTGEQSSPKTEVVATVTSLQELAAQKAIAERSDSDRLHAVELKLDRILEALGRPRETAAKVAYDHSLLGKLPGQPATASAPEAALKGADTAAGIAPPQDLLPIATALTSAAPDRLTAVERRMADLERRVADLERRVNQAWRGGGTASATPKGS
jgi:RNA polymerase sigma factor (sigma-70 family)